MTQEKPQDIAGFWIHRARRTVEEAQLLAGNDHWNTCASQLYYACFYALTALFKTVGLDTSKHTGVRAAFFQRYVKTGMVAGELGDLYRDLFEARRESDYEDYLLYEEDDVRPWINQVEEFISVIEKIIEQSRSK